MAKYLTIDEILAANDLPEADVYVPEWGKGANVRVRGLTLARQTHIRNSAKDESGKIDGEKLQLLLLVNCVLWPDGSMPTDAQIEELRQKNVKPIERIVIAIGKLNGAPEAGAADPAATFLPSAQIQKANGANSGVAELVHGDGATA